MKFKNTPRLTCLLLILSGWIALFGGVTFFMKIIEINSPTYGLKQVFVDDEDFDRINKFKWTLKKSHNTFYARRSSKSPTWILMHREIINVDDKSIHYDHVDTNGLNNQKINLRRCNHSQSHIETSTGGEVRVNIFNDTIKPTLTLAVEQVKELYKLRELK